MGYKSNKKIVGVLPMVADLLHAGHINAIIEAKNNCDYLILMLNCAPTKGDTVQSIFERFWQLDVINQIDKVIPYGGEQDLLNALGCLDYQVRFLGDDYINKNWTGKEMETERGIEPYFMMRQYHGFSSSELKKRIKEI